MDYVYFSLNIKPIEKRINNDINEFISFLQTMGNNHKYDYESQLTIYDQYPTAIACASDKTWQKLGREVKKHQKAILVKNNVEKTIEMVFDVSQTVSKQKDAYYRWNFKEIDNNQFIALYNKIEDTTLETIQSMIDYEINNNVISILDNYFYFSQNNTEVLEQQRKEFESYIEESLKIAIYARLNIAYIPKIEALERIHHNVTIANSIRLLSETNQKIIEKIIYLSKTLPIEKKEELNNEFNSNIRNSGDVNRGDIRDSRDDSTEQSVLLGEKEDSFLVGSREERKSNILLPTSTGFIQPRQTGELSFLPGENDEENMGERTTENITSQSDLLRTRSSQFPNESTIRDVHISGRLDGVHSRNTSSQGATSEYISRSRISRELGESTKRETNVSNSVQDVRKKRTRNIGKSNKKINVGQLSLFSYDILDEPLPFTEEINNELQFNEQAEMIALNVGYEYIFVPKNEVNIDIKNTNQTVVLQDTAVFVYKGATFADSQKIDQLIDVSQEVYRFEDSQLQLVKNQSSISELDNFQITQADIDALNIYFEKNGFDTVTLETVQKNEFIDLAYTEHELFDEMDENPILIGMEVTYDLKQEQLVTKLFNEEYEYSYSDIVSMDKQEFFTNANDFDFDLLTSMFELSSITEEEVYQQLYTLKMKKTQQDIEKAVSKSNQAVIEKAKNYIEQKEETVQTLLPSERLKLNVDAIRILKENKDNPITHEQQEILSKYVGWGGLADVFDETKDGQWLASRYELKQLLSENEYEQAKESTLTAFYTPSFIAKEIVHFLQECGVEKCNVLEPSCAVGSFIQEVKKQLQDTHVYGVELDIITGQIAKRLYPEETIQIKGFEKTNFSNNFFDVAIGNVPFGNYSVHDTNYNKHKFLIHDYFFAKTIDKVRENGIIVFITSSGTLDKKDNRIRKYIGERCEFLGAIRLPNNTFKGKAGTEVTSDVIFLKKKAEISIGDQQDFYSLKEMSYWDTRNFSNQEIEINQYFVDNPHMMLGKMEQESSPFGMKNVLKPNENFSYEQLQSDFRNVLKNISYQYTKNSINTEKHSDITIPATDDVKNYSYTVVNDDIYYRENSIMIYQEFDNKKKELILDYLNLDICLRNLLEMQLHEAEDGKIVPLQQELTKQYDNFVKKYGRLNERKVTKYIKEDSNFPLLSTLEILDEEGKFLRKSDIFDRRTIKKAETITSVDNPKDALILSLNEYAKVDLPFMAKLSDLTIMELLEKLKYDIYIDIPLHYDELPMMNEIGDYLSQFHNNTVEFITAEEFLSGNVREKYEKYKNWSASIEQIQMENVSEEEKTFFVNKIKQQEEVLKNILPKWIEAEEINVGLGATWIPVTYYHQFIHELFNSSSYERNHCEVQYSLFTNEYYISDKNINNDVSRNSEYGVFNLSGESIRVSAYQIYQDTLNLKQTKIYDNDFTKEGKETKVLNKELTRIADSKQEILKEKFKTWIFNDYDRRMELEQIYNHRFNGIVNREFNGKNLIFHGKNPQIQLREHQENAVARILYGGNTLLAHTVGAGKTYTMVASIKEGRRLGLFHKAMIVVPNHLTEQVGREFLELYPFSNILVAKKKDFTPQSRKRFISKIATGDYDAIIIGHTQFEKIQMSPNYIQNFIQNEITTVKNFIRYNKKSWEQKYSVKQAQIKLKQLQKRLESVLDTTRKDDVIYFESLGVDKLYVDEAHYFKNLFIHTKMSNVSGIGKTDSLRANDMYLKTRFLNELTNSKGVVFATGTPISNSMSELYTMQRYLQYDLLTKYGWQDFDSWATMFGTTTSDLEIAPEGTKFQVKTRFAKFYNLPELITVFKECADIKTADMLDLPVPKANFEVLKTQASEIQKEFLNSFVARADAVRNKQVDPSDDNMLNITNDGKKLALDQRLLNPLLEDDRNSKVNVCVNNIARIYFETEKNKTAQLVFCDMSTPSPNCFNIYDDIKQKLIIKGVKENEIAFIHDANTDKEKDSLFANVRSGKVRVLLGSTQKMGAGTNVQERLIALHDLDVPWRPSDLEQRAGRIIRQGNSNEEVFIYRYVTENTFDSYLWQTIENKQKFISQIMTSKAIPRIIDDCDETVLNYSEIKAIATGNPLFKEKMDLENQISKLKLLETSHNASKYKYEKELKENIPSHIALTTSLLNKVKKDIALTQFDCEEFSGIEIRGKIYRDKKIAGNVLLNTVSRLNVNMKVSIGSYRGFEIKAYINTMKNRIEYELHKTHCYSGVFGEDPIGNLTRMDNTIHSIIKYKDNLKNKMNNYQLEIQRITEIINKPFEKKEELRNKIVRLNEINQEIAELENKKIEDKIQSQSVNL